MAKAKLPEPQGRAGLVEPGGNDGDTHSLLDKGTVGRGPLSLPRRRILRYQGQRSERGAYVERIWMNALNGDCPSLNASKAMVLGA